MSLETRESNPLPRRQPFIYLAATLAAGILFDTALQAPALTATFAAAMMASLALIFLLRHLTHAAAASLLICVIATGAALSSAERAVKNASDLKRLYESGLLAGHDAIEITGVLAQPPEPAPAAYYLDLNAESIRYATETRNANGNVKLLIETPESNSRTELEELHLEYGSRVRVLARLERPQSYGNPGSPDFNEFLERKGYDLSGRVKTPLLIENMGLGRINPPLALLYDLRIRLINSIDARFEPRLGGVLKAMLAGNRNFIDEETALRLREGGTFHTLVIAGLHVGIIAWALLGWRRLRRITAWVALSILVLWAHVVMVGLAAPVVRATIMISVGLIGPLLFRRAVSLNTVALAAFIMLAWKPSLIADPRFQLSFAAVGGIVAMAMPLIAKLREIGEWRPTSRLPHPPACSRWITSLAEVLFWDQRKFDRDMAATPVHYSLEKSRAALLLNRMRVQGLLKAAAVLLFTSAAIQAATAPLMILYFNRLSPVGVFLNVTAGLFTAALMLSGYAAMLAGGLSTWLASQLVLLCSAAHYLLVNSVVPFLGCSLATLRVPQYEGLYRIIYVIYYVHLVIFAVIIAGWRPVKGGSYGRSGVRRGQKPAGGKVKEPRSQVTGGKRIRIANAIAFVAVFAALMRPIESIPRCRLTVYFLDVGQGDAALVVFPGGCTMLVDGGGEIRFDHAEPARRESAAQAPDYLSKKDNATIERNSNVGELVVSRFLWSLGLRRIDYLVATHSHQDHVGGLFSVIDNFRIGELLVGRPPQSDIEYLKLTQAARRKGVAIGSIAAGDRFDLDGVTVEVLWPSTTHPSPVVNGNNESIVLRLSIEEVSILMAADIEKEAEEAMVRASVPLHADVLKAPHHGSRTSSSQALLNVVRPVVAVVSVGEQSRFGHPHSEVLSRYLSSGVSLYRTGKSGMVSAQTDGRTFSIHTFRP